MGRGQGARCFIHMNTISHQRRGYAPTPDAPTRKTSRTGNGKPVGRETFEEGLTPGV